MHEKHDWTMYVWLIYLSFFLVVPWATAASVTVRILTLAGAAVFLALYFYGHRVGGRRMLPVIAGITLLGLLFYPFNPGAGAFFIYAASFAARLDERGRPVMTILLIEILAVAEVAIFRVSVYNAIWPVILTPLIGAVNLHYMGVNRSNQRLRLAHDEIERLAKVAERERIARDLHDLLGHTLSLIILKSELASKLADRDPARARDEIRDVERISREALAQVRQAVGGYRTRGLVSEVESAREMLAAAAIACSAEVQPAVMPAAHEAILSLALREAVTNVVRHSRAKHCTIRFVREEQQLRLTIADDGRGGSGEEGFGLRGMRERIAALGGTLSRQDSDGTLLEVVLPLDALEHSA